MSRNLPWSKEEIILALDLYFNPHRGAISTTNPNLSEVSRELNKLRATSQVMMKKSLEILMVFV
jgi:hypothetical protein